MLRQKISRLIVTMAIVMLGAGTVSVAVAPTTYAAGGGGCSSKFLTFPTWYDGLLDSKCNIKSPASTTDGLSNFIWRIALNILEIVLQVVAYLSVGFIIFGGFKYLTSTGSSDKITAARKTIMNAVIGLIIALVAVAIVALIADRIKA